VRAPCGHRCALRFLLGLRHSSSCGRDCADGAVGTESVCVLNAAGGASDTPFATPHEPYRVIDIQNSRFFRARALSGLGVTEVNNTHFLRRSRDFEGLHLIKA
jgi:hypothetical protein